MKLLRFLSLPRTAMPNHIDSPRPWFWRARLLRAIYSGVSWLLTPAILLYLAGRARKQPEYLQHLGERWGWVKTRTDGANLIWVHAVSVGETHAAQPLIVRLLERYPNHRLLLTHMTPTGRAASQKLFAEYLQAPIDGSVPRMLVSYIPYDFYCAVRRFIRRMQPQALLLLETELWPNLIHAAHTYGCKTALVNARLSEKSARKMARFKSLAEHALLTLEVVAAQTYPDAARLQSFAQREVAVTGNLKFDIWPSRQQLEIGQQLRSLIAAPSAGQARPIVLAASTRDGEEALLLKAYAEFISQGWLLILVPRHPQRFEAVAHLLKDHGIPYQRRSEGGAVDTDCQVLLGDTMGEMFSYYEACDVALIGGSLLPLGGQNLIEACAVGRPVLVGPHTFNFAQATHQAIEAGAAIRVADATSAFAKIQQLFLDPSLRDSMGKAALAFSQRHRGATQRIIEQIKPLLENQPVQLVLPWHGGAN